MRMGRNKRAAERFAATVLGSAVLVALLAGCENEFTRGVHQKCANAPDVKACEQAEYDRLYSIERARNQRISYP